MGIISGLGSFRGQFGDHFRVGDHFGIGIISGAVQISNKDNTLYLFHGGNLTPTNYLSPLKLNDFVDKELVASSSIAEYERPR